MLFRISPETFWNMIASKYAAAPIDDLPAYKSKVEQLKSYLKPDYNILDIGCGTGTQCIDLAGSVKHVTGADHSKKILDIAEQRKAKQKIENVEFLKATLADMKFPAEQFDVVMAFYVLHFYEDIEDIIKRIHTWLKPGGLLITESYCLGDKNIFQIMWLRFFGLIGIMPLINVLTQKKLEQTLANTGFTLLEKKLFKKRSSEYTLIVCKQEMEKVS